MFSFRPEILSVKCFVEPLRLNIHADHLIAPVGVFISSCAKRKKKQPCASILMKISVHGILVVLNFRHDLNRCVMLHACVRRCGSEYG